MNNNKNKNNMDYDSNVDYDSDYSSYEDSKKKNPSDLHSNDLFESESFLGCYADSDFESNVLSAEEKYLNWIYSDIDVSNKKKINYPFPILVTGEVLTPSRIQFYKERQENLLMIEDKIIFLQKEIEKHDKKFIELSLLHNLPKYSASTIIRMEKMRKQQEEEDKIEKEKRDMYMRNMIIENTKSKNFNTKKVFGSNVKIISEDVIKQRRAVKKIESKIRKMEDKNKEEMISIKLKEEQAKAAENKKIEEDHKKKEFIEKIKQDCLSNTELTTLEDRLIVLQHLDSVKEIEVIEDELKQEKIKKMKYVQEKIAGWEITFDRKKEIAKREKVKFLCDSILKNRPCRHGDKCNFSHVVLQCPFGIKCMNVAVEEGKYINKIGERTKMCTFIHYEENISDFNIRVGIEVNKKEEKKEVKCHQKENIKLYIVTGIDVNENTWINIASKGIKREKTVEIVEIAKVEIKEEKKPEVKKILNKTQMCTSVVNNVSCRHGSKCRFAHDKYELTCSFGENCRNIKKNNEKYVNAQDSNYCCRLHPGETIDSLKERIGVKSDIKTVVEEIKKVETLTVDVKKIQHQHIQQQQIQHHQIQQQQIQQQQIQQHQMQHQQIQQQQIQQQQIQQHQIQQQQMQQQQMQSRKIDGWVNAKVKLCMYIGRCREGVNCKYAHSKEEIECGYGNSCKNVCWDGYKYINTSNVKCDRRHPYESKEGVKWRCGNK